MFDNVALQFQRRMQSAVRHPIADRRIVFCFPQLFLGLSRDLYDAVDGPPAVVAIRILWHVHSRSGVLRVLSDCERQRSAAKRNPPSSEQSPEQIDSNGKQLFLAIREKSPRPMKKKRLPAKENRPFRGKFRETCTPKSQVHAHDCDRMQFAFERKSIA